MYDSVFLAADEVLRDQPGRKTIILISDGVDMGSIVSRYDAIEAAQRADTIIYSIRYYDDQAYGRGGGGARGGGRGSRGGRGGDSNRESAGLTALEQMSIETGGRMFEVQDGLPLEAIFEMIQEELRNQYSIGYTPTTETAEEFRQIKLVAKDKGLRVQARTGYYSGRAD
jgi:VWFA-related protein